jgi:curli biogenesis system outer membrane secretion channel CsgG
MRRAFRCAGLVAGLLVLSLACSCAPSVRMYVNPEADLAFYRKIAVLPFTDMSSVPQAGPRVTRAFVTELILTDRFEIIQPEDFAGALHRQGTFLGQDGTYDPDKLKDAATQLGVTGILRGAVTEYQMSRSSDGGDIPVIAFDAELTDVATGKVVWRSSITKRGKGRVAVVGGGTRSLGKLTQEACQELVAELRKRSI